jgi:hypothetical protein
VPNRGSNLPLDGLDLVQRKQDRPLGRFIEFQAVGEFGDDLGNDPALGLVSLTA